MGRSYNPFSPSHWTPATIDYVFESGEEENLLAVLRASGWYGLIVGPQGSGKSTLLAELQSRLPSLGFRTVLVRVREEPLYHGAVLWRVMTMGPRKILLLDSAECLLPGLFPVILGLVRLWGGGVVATLHRIPSGWPYKSIPAIPRRTQGSTLFQVIRTQFAGLDLPEWLSEPLVDQLLANHQGHAREVLAELYGMYEAGFPGQ